MSKYKKRLPIEPSFKQEGLNGYNFNLDCKEISLSVEDVFKGHDKYYKNKESSKIYYVLDGKGIFSINNEKIIVSKGELIEIPANTEYVFAGKMKLLMIMSPAFKPENDVFGKENDLY